MQSRRRGGFGFEVVKFLEAGRGTRSFLRARNVFLYGWRISAHTICSQQLNEKVTCPRSRLFVQVESRPLEISKHYGIYGDRSSLNVPKILVMAEFIVCGSTPSTWSPFGSEPV